MSPTRIQKAILKNKAIHLKKTKAKYDARFKLLEQKIKTIQQFNEQACMRLFKNTRQIDLIKKFIDAFEENFDNFTNEYDLLVAINAKKIDQIEPRILNKVAKVLHKFGLQEAMSPPPPQQLVATAPLFHEPSSSQQKHNPLLNHTDSVRSQ